MNEIAAARERHFLIALYNTGNPVLAAADAGYDDPEVTARELMRLPRIKRAIAAMRDASLADIIGKGARITSKWLDKVEQQLASAESPSEVPMKEVIRAIKVISDMRRQDAQETRKQALAEISMRVLEQVAERAGVDIADMTGRRLIDGEAEEI